MAAGAWASDFGLNLEFGVVALTGFTLLLMPRVAYEIVDMLEVELGAIVIEGPPPPMNVTPRIAIGTVYDTTDQVFLGLSYSL